MFYDFTLTIPASTAKSSPTEDVVKVTHGVLHRIEVSFPAGCAGLAHLVVLHEEHQLYPTNLDGSFAADGYTIPIDDYFELFDHPYALKLRGWNLDDTYQHIVTVRLGIYPQDVAAKIFGRRTTNQHQALLEAFGITVPEL